MNIYNIARVVMSSEIYINTVVNINLYNWQVITGTIFNNLPINILHFEMWGENGPHLYTDTKLIRSPEFYLHLNIWTTVT